MKRQRERERGRKKSPNEDKYMYVCAYKVFLTFIHRRKRRKKKPLILDRTG
jgi:hypothetical protein